MNILSLVANEVADEQMDEFISRLHGRSLEEELKLAGLWGNGAARGITTVLAESVEHFNNPE